MDKVEYKENREYFDKILLFKPQGEMTYIRKLSMSYGYYTALAVVNKQNYVTHIGANNNFKILPFSKLSRKYRNLLGTERCNHLQDDDIMSVYRINSPMKLDSAYHLLKPCKSMRYTLPEETYEIKRLILHTLSNIHNVSVYDAKRLGEYTDLYQKEIPLDFSNVLFNIDEDYSDDTMVTTPVYDSDGAHGQTRLI